jgi:hypothetical protein
LADELVDMLADGITFAETSQRNDRQPRSAGRRPMRAFSRYSSRHSVITAEQRGGSTIADTEGPAELVWLARHVVYGLAALHTGGLSFPRSVDNQFICFTRHSPDIQSGFAAAQLLQGGTIRLST